MSLPPLPARPGGEPWSANVEHATQIVATTFNKAARVLTQEAALLVQMELHSLEESIPRDWINTCARLAADLVVNLLAASDTASAQ